MKNYKASLIIFLVFALLIPLSLFSQKKATYSIFLTPEFSFTNIRNPDNLVLGGRDEPDEGIGFGYAIGGALEYEMTNSVIIRAGIQYEISKYRYNADFGNPFDAENFARINSVGIPVNLGKRINTKKEQLSYLPSLGILFNINLSEDSNGFITINPAKLSSFFAWEIEQTLTNNLRFGIEPFFKYTPNEFTIFANQVEVRTRFEMGMNLKVKF